MQETIIKSRDNQLARRARAVREGKVEDLIFVEGYRLAEEALRASLVIDQVICSEQFSLDERGARLIQSLEQSQTPVSLASGHVFTSISDTKSPQGIIVIANRPPTGRVVLEQLSEETPLLVIMHRINNPANAGAILRAAEAAGATGAVTTTDSTNLFSPKALRGAMGSTFRLPLWIGAGYLETLSWCQERGIRTLGADLRAQCPHTEIDWRRPCALIVGSEATGLSKAEAAAVDERVRIPMRAPVESLNVAVASAIVLYEAARQRSEAEMG